MNGVDVFDVMVQEHLDNPKASMVYSNMYKTDSSLNIQSEWYGKDIAEDDTVLESKGWPISHFVSFKKDLYNKTEGVDAFMLRAIDYDLYYKLEEVGYIIHVNRFFYNYRNTPNSISLNDNLKKAHYWHVYACVKAMKRRSIRDESLMFFPLEKDFRYSWREGYKSCCYTKTYRIGKLVSSPVRLIRKIFHKS